MSPGVWEIEVLILCHPLALFSILYLLEWTPRLQLFSDLQRSEKIGVYTTAANMASQVDEAFCFDSAVRGHHVY